MIKENPDKENPGSDEIHQVLHDRFGLDYLFPYQQLVITSVLEAAGWFGREAAEEAPQRRIVILPTGAGKSLCFMLPAALLPRPALVVFPLLSLMADQKRRFDQAGIPAYLLKGGQSRTERQEVEEKLESGECRVLLSNPETLLQPRIRRLLDRFHFSHLVIDETHTVSEWGDTFRPAYRELHTLMTPSRFAVVTAFTATASDHILERLQNLLFSDNPAALIRANPDRPNIAYHVHPCLSKTRRLLHLLSPSPSDTAHPLPRPCVVFCSSRPGTERLARIIRSSLPGIPVRCYHAGFPREAKKEIEEWFFPHESAVLVSTSAYGMGVDKSGIRAVVHYDIPATVESYLQESGRAGRDRRPAEAHLLTTPADGTAGPTGSSETAFSRWQDMLAYARNPSVCRRRQLLALLQAEPEGCTGCDVCRGTAQAGPPELAAVLRPVARHTGRLRLREALFFLKGWAPPDIRARRIPQLTGFGTLRSWQTDSIREALASLMQAGILLLPQHGLWKGRLALPAGNPGKKRPDPQRRPGTKKGVRKEKNTNPPGEVKTPRKNQEKEKVLYQQR